MPNEERADVAIVGSATAGLVAGAILARHGRRVVVLEHANTPGGRAGSVRRPDGWWIDFGHRDGHDVGDCQLLWQHGIEAAAEADVALSLRRVTHPLRVHHLPEDAVIEGDWGPGGFLAAARSVFECPEDGLFELTQVVRRLAVADAATVDAAIPERLGTWLPGVVRHPGVRRALLLMAAVIFHRHPEEASVGRLMQFLQRPPAGPYIADDEEAGGMQGLLAPFARALVARGGEIALGWKPVEIMVADGAVRGVVAVDRTNLVREVHAPVVIGTYPVWEQFDLVDRARFPPAFVAAADALRSHQADLIGWQVGLHRLPAVRATGLPEDHAGWNRILAGAERAYRGGWQLTSLTSRSAAPPGKHLLSLVAARWVRDGTPSWASARAELDEAIAYLHRFYADLDACTEWSAYQWVTAPQTMSWAWAPLRRHDLEVATIRGLLLAGSTIESPAGIVDIGAWAGLAAARRALALLG